MLPTWSTACPDWEERIVAGRSLLPCGPLFPAEAEASLDVFRNLRITDVAGRPTFGEASRPWVFDLPTALFGAYDAESGRRLIREAFLLVSKKNGKALALDTPIPTPSGWTTMGELEVGALVFGTDGRPCRVVATSEVFVDHDCYRLEFSNGESVIADAGHRWLTKALANEPGSGAGNRRTAPRTRLRTTDEIARSLFRPGDGARNHSLAMPAPIVTGARDLPVAPYTLGAWLGDGHSACAKITCHQQDSEILDGIRADGWPVRFASNNGSAARTYAISDGDRTQRARDLSLAARLRAAGLLNNKHIPEEYFRASFAQRLALLQGLMDTDGTISKSGRVLSFCGKNERLVRGVAELLSTFGVKNSVKARPVACNGVPAGLAYFVQFMAFRDVLPVFRLERKLARMRTRGLRAARSQTVQIVGATPVAAVPVKCISVDTADHQFLFGRSLLPTHNSTLAPGIMLTALIRNWREQGEFYIIAPTKELADNSFGPALAMVKADDDLNALIHPQPAQRVLIHRKTEATLRVIAADSQAATGKKTIGLLIEELHEFGARSDAGPMLREARGGLASRPEGFEIRISTQSSKPPKGVFADTLAEYRDIRDGKVVAPHKLPLLYEFPKPLLEEKAYENPAFWHVTNPNLGLSVDEQYLREQQDEARRKGRAELADFYAKHLNVEIGQAMRADGWAGAALWERGIETGLTLDELLARSEVVTVGIDGGGLDDLLGIGIIGRERGTKRWLAWGHALVSTVGLSRRKANAGDYLLFKKDGDLDVFRFAGFESDPEEMQDLPSELFDDLLAAPDSGLAADVSYVVGLVARIRDRGLLAQVGVDAAGIGGIVDALDGIGVTQDEKQLGAVRQGIALMGAFKTIERKLADRSFRHGGQRLMGWCAGNAKLVATRTAQMLARDEAGYGKVDPLVALFNAAALMAMNPEPSGGRSIYDREDLWAF